MQQIHQDDAPVGPSLGLTNPSFSAETLLTSSKLTADSFLFMQIIREILKSCGLGYTSEKMEFDALHGTQINTTAREHNNARYSHFNIFNSIHNSLNV